jgi:hypothetical protein
MRFLKRKITAAESSLIIRTVKQSFKIPRILNKTINKLGLDRKKLSALCKKRKIEKSPDGKTFRLCLKNVAKNFGRAICSFISSDIANQYIDNLRNEYQFDINGLKAYMNQRKLTFDGIEDFKEMLIPRDSDKPEEKTYKLLFQKLGIIFMKYFSVNWICTGRLNYKLDYLKVRFKVLRRIQNPNLFTYIR